MMETSPDIQKIIDEIFNPNFAEQSHDWHKNLPIASQDSLMKLVTLICEQRNEEEFQLFFSTHGAGLSIYPELVEGFQSFCTEGAKRIPLQSLKDPSKL